MSSDLFPYAVKVVYDEKRFGPNNSFVIRRRNQRALQHAVQRIQERYALAVCTLVEWPANASNQAVSDIEAMLLGENK